MGKWTNEQIDKWTNGQMDKWTNGQKDGVKGAVESNPGYARLSGLPKIIVFNYLINRLGVAGAVLHTALSFSN